VQPLLFLYRICNHNHLQPYEVILIISLFYFFFCSIAYHSLALEQQETYWAQKQGKSFFYDGTIMMKIVIGFSEDLIVGRRSVADPNP